MQALNLGTLFLQAVTLLTIGWLVRRYFPSYFSEKGKNLATKEDIGRITAEVERVRLRYAEDLENVKNRLQERIELARHELSLALESSRRYENLRVQAYVDFINGIAGVANAQRHHDAPKELESLALLTDAKVRIAVYGSKDVLVRLGTFFEEYGALTSRDAMLVFLEAIQKMREESASRSDNVSLESISQLLFASGPSE
jgi:hypothetical protein